MLEDFPANSRVWFFSLASPLGPKNASFSEQLSKFINGWLAHGAGVRGSFEIVYDQLVVVAADPEVTQVSGCSIDTLFRAVKEIAEANDNSLASTSQVAYLDNESPEIVSRGQFRELREAKKITPETIVFDNTVETLGDVRSGKWELPLKDSWHAKL